MAWVSDRGADPLARLRRLLSGPPGVGAERHARGVASVTELIGEWTLCATTAGFFERPRVDDADFVFEQSGPDHVRFRVDLTRRGRRIHIDAIAGVTPGPSGLYNWKGRGGRLVAMRSQWGLARTADGKIAALHHPASMASDAGAVLMLRSGVAPEGARQLVRRGLSELLLDESDYRQLDWRL